MVLFNEQFIHWLWRTFHALSPVLSSDSPWFPSSTLISSSVNLDSWRSQQFEQDKIECWVWHRRRETLLSILDWEEFASYGEGWLTKVFSLQRCWALGEKNGVQIPDSRQDLVVHMTNSRTLVAKQADLCEFQDRLVHISSPRPASNI